MNNKLDFGFEGEEKNLFEMSAKGIDLNQYPEDVVLTAWERFKDYCSKNDVTSYPKLFLSFLSKAKGRVAFGRMTKRETEQERPKNKFHNFREKPFKYTDKELEKILRSN